MHILEEYFGVILLHFDVLFRCLRISSQLNCLLSTSTLYFHPIFCVGDLLQYKLTGEQWNEPSSLHHTHKATEETKHNSGTIFEATQSIMIHTFMLLINSSSNGSLGSKMQTRTGLFLKFQDFFCFPRFFRFKFTRWTCTFGAKPRFGLAKHRNKVTTNKVV